MFYVTGGACIMLGIYSFSLMHTPAPAKGKKASMGEVLGLDAVKLLKQPPFFVFMLCSLLICVPLATYYAFAPIFVGDSGALADANGETAVAFYMSFGQISEIVFMLLMPLFFVRLGVKWMLLVGMLAWVVRYGLFAGAATDSVAWMIIGGIVLHGICYDFFFVTGQIYTDKKASPEVRGQAQGFLVLVTQGIGMFAGAQIAGRLSNSMLVGKEGAELLTAYRTFWLIPCIAAAAIMVIFFLFFWDKDVSAKDESAATTEWTLGGRLAEWQG
jgi:nucleoside transporter